MKTLVYQSYRTIDVAPWIRRCLDTVRDWAEVQGFEYRFIDDALFDFVPAWYRQKVANNILLVSDLARLEAAKQFLSSGYERVIWVDADVLVFDPDRFRIDVVEEYAFCRELWLAQDESGMLNLFRRVHNAVSVYVTGNHFLDFYSFASQRIVREQDAPTSLDIGTRFLSSVHRFLPHPLLENVGMFSPALLQLIDQRRTDVLSEYRESFGKPVYAANLCASLSGQPDLGVGLLDRVVDHLLSERGGVLAN